MARNGMSAFMGLLLNAQRARAGCEDRSADFTLGKRNVEDGCGLFGATGWLPLLLDERVVLLFGGIASSFFISSSVGLLCGGSAPGLERLAEEHASSCSRCREQWIFLAEGVPEQSAASGADRISEKPRRARARAAGEKQREHGRDDEWFNLHARRLRALRWPAAPLSERRYGITLLRPL